MANMRVRNAGPRDALYFRMLGFRDYEAARRLLLGDLPMQGATLASTALEKYLKCILATSGLKANIHLDNLDAFKDLFSKKGIGIFNELDPVFVETLSKAYRLRYYDNVDTVVFGFFKWQLLGELDATIGLIEQRLKARTASGEEVRSPYAMAVDDRDPTICDENYLVLGESKKKFMERKGPAIMMRLDSLHGEIQVQAKELGAASYKGRITSLVNVRIGSNS